MPKLNELRYFSLVKEVISISIHKRIVLLTILLCCITAFCTAGEIASVRINKVQIDWPEAKLYFDILDSQGHPEQETVPSDFMAIIGVSRAAIKEIKPVAASVEGIAYTLLIDTSHSLSSEEFTQIQHLMAAIVNEMTSNDQACIMTFNKEATLIQNFTANKEVLQNKLSALSPTDNPVYLYQSLAKALKTASMTDDRLPSRRAVIMVSDGENDANDDFTGEIFEILQSNRLPIYAVGYSKTPFTGDKQTHLDFLGELARYSGGAYYQCQSSALPPIYTDIFKTSKAGYVAYLTCPPLNDGPGAYKIQLSLKDGDKLFTDTIETRITPGVPPTSAIQPNNTTPPSKVPLELPLVYIVAVSGILVLIALKIYKHKNTPSPLTAEHSTSQESFYSDSQTATTTEHDTNQPAEPIANRYSPPIAQHSSPQCLNLLLTTLNNPSETFSIYLTDTIILGSSGASNLTLTHDNDISATHCKLSQQNAKLYVTDLASTSGTFVNNVPIKMRIQLHDGDLLRIGKTELRVTF